MNKEYVNPAMSVETIESETFICLSLGEGVATSNSCLGKDREEIWEEDTDLWGNLWGNDCDTRVE